MDRGLPIASSAVQTILGETRGKLPTPPCGADDQGRANGSTISVGHHQRDHPSGDERERRVDECEDPEDQGDGLRVPQQGTIPNGDLVSHWWPVAHADDRLKESAHTEVRSPVLLSFTIPQ
jgi:hypothetical protein